MNCRRMFNTSGMFDQKVTSSSLCVMTAAKMITIAESHVVFFPHYYDLCSNNSADNKNKTEWFLCNLIEAIYV